MCLSQQNMNEILYCVNYLDTIQEQELTAFKWYIRDDLLIKCDNSSKPFDDEVEMQEHESTK